MSKRGSGISGKDKEIIKIDDSSALCHPVTPQPALATMQSWARIDLRIGRILTAEVFAKARKPAYKLSVDFGGLGTRQSSAQLTFAYPDPAVLVGQPVVAVVNFPARRIAGFESQVLVTGFYADEKRVFLLQPSKEDCRPGTRVSLVGVPEEEPSSSEATIDDFVACKIYCGTVIESNGDEATVDCGEAGRLSCTATTGPLTIGTIVVLTIVDGRGRLLVAGDALLTTQSTVPNGTILA